MNKGEGLCKGEACELAEDQATCCEKHGVCGDVVCDANLHHVSKASAPTYCDGTTCQVSECCAEKQTCDVSGLDCGDGRHFKVGAETIHCAGEFCDADDSDTCCEDKGNCSAMESGDGMVYCSMFTGCAEGLISNAATTECAATGCTSDLCCLQAYGPPLPETLAEPAQTDTFKAGFKLEASFEALQANPTLMDNLKDNICEKFAQTTGTDKAWCDAEFTAGSVNVAVTITAPANTQLPAHMPTPTPTEVVATVTAIPDIASIQKGDTPISASEVRAVVFKTGQTGGVAPTTTTTTTTTVAPQATSEEPVDNAMSMSTATSFVLAIVLIFQDS